MSELDQIKMAQMQKDIDYIREKMDVFDETLKNFVEKADERYAPKWVADVLKWLFYTAGGVVVVTIVYMFIKFGHLAV